MYDLDLIEELEFFENDELDSIEEASTQNNIREYAKGLIRTIFQHMIKYQYNQKNRVKVGYLPLYVTIKNYLK